MKRIGILTFHNTLNYGAHLQAYALCRYIRDLGYECDIIDYQSDSIVNSYDLRFRNHISSPKSFLKYIMTVGDLKRKKSSFEKFLIPYVSHVSYFKNTAAEMAIAYDAIVVGSDQVWNLELTGNDKTFYLDFPGEMKRLSYAASFGKHPLDIKGIDECKNCLKAFDGLAVREADAVSYLNEMGLTNVLQTIDPTFLLTRNQWKELLAGAGRYRQKKKYVLVYAQGRPQLGMQFAENLAKREALEIIVVHSYAKKFPNAKNIRDASLTEFLMLINDAEYVVTTSFHGMALALMLGKDLYYEEKKNVNNANSRLKSLADLMNIKERALTTSEFDKKISPIDYEYVGKVIKREREKANSFLLEFLG